MDNAVFRDTLFIQGVVVYMPVGQSGGGEKFLHGIGTLSSMMLPYTIALLVSLTFMLYLFWWLDIPLGFQADYVYPRRF